MSRRWRGWGAKNRGFPLAFLVGGAPGLPPRAEVLFRAEVIPPAVITADRQLNSCFERGLINRLIGADIEYDIVISQRYFERFTGHYFYN